MSTTILMEFFLHLILCIKNFLLVSDQQIYFLIVFHLTLQTTKVTMTSLSISAILIKSSKTPYGISRLLLLYLIQVSKTMLLHLQLISTQNQMLLQNPFTMLSISHQLRQNCLQLDMELIKQSKLLMHHISQLLLMLSIQ